MTHESRRLTYGSLRRFSGARQLRHGSQLATRCARDPRAQSQAWQAGWRFATDAIAASADPRWYPADGGPHAVKLVLWTSPVPVFALGEKPELRNEPGIDYLIDITSHSAAKQAALASHRTQWAGLEEGVFVDRNSANSLRYEAFRVGSGPRPLIAPQSDLP